MAAKFGCTAGTLQHWVRQAERGSGVRALEREVREVRKANEILRKSSAYLAQVELDHPLKRLSLSTTPEASILVCNDELLYCVGPYSACVPAPSPGGCRLRSHGGSQWPDGFSDPSGVSMGCGLLWFSGQLSDECGPGHQIECGIFQYWDVGGRHMAPKHQIWRAGTMSRPPWAATQWSRIRPTQEIAPNPLTHNHRELRGKPCWAAAQTVVQPLRFDYSAIVGRR